jgi:hypothetical protein
VQGYWGSEERWTAWARVTVIIGFDLGYVYINVLLNKANGTVPDPPHGGAAAGGWHSQSGDKQFIQTHNCLFYRRENSGLRRHIHFENTTRCGFTTLSGGVRPLELRFAQDSNICRKDVTDGGGPCARVSW